MTEWDEEAIPELEQLTDGLRSGELDHRLIAYKSWIGHRWNDPYWNLCRLLYDSPVLTKNSDAKLSSDQKSSGLNTSPRKDQPTRKIVELLSELGLEEQFFVYLSRFSEPPCGGLARAFECLQVPSIVRRKHDGDCAHFCLVQELNHFRLAQKLRDEYGSARSKSPSNCFQCFEDIVELERSLFGGDRVPLVVECCELKLVNLDETYCMFDCASTSAQLLTVFDAVNRSRGSSNGRDLQTIAHRHFEYHFVRLTQRGTQP